MNQPVSIPSVSVTYAGDGRSTRLNELGMRPMQERAYQMRGEQYLLIKSPPASGKGRALMFIALDKLENQGLKQLDIGYYFYSGSYADARASKCLAGWSVKGLKARGGSIVDITWRSGKVTIATIRSTQGEEARVRIGERLIPIELKPGESTDLTNK